LGSIVVVPTESETGEMQLSTGEDGKKGSEKKGKPSRTGREANDRTEKNSTESAQIFIKEESRKGDAESKRLRKTIKRGSQKAKDTHDEKKERFSAPNPGGRWPMQGGSPATGNL